jgi:hypothetical protein
VLTIVLFVFFKSAEINYKNVTDGITMEYEALPKRGGMLELTNISTGEEKSITITEFQDKAQYIPFIPEKTLWQKLKESWFILPVWIAFVILFGLLDYWEVRKSNKIYSILNKKE